MDNTEVIFLLHSLREPKFFKSLKKETFNNPYLSSFYWLVQDFWEKYREIPLDPDNPSLEQVKEVIRVEDKYYKINPDLSDDKNKEAFLSNCETILGNNYSKYSPKAVDENMKAWVDWENFQERFVKSGEYMKTTKVSPTNAKEVIAKAREIFNDFSMADDDDELPSEYYDAEYHEQEEEQSIGYPSGWQNFDLICNGKGNGQKVGNFVILVGAPNIGKSIFLGNIAVSSSLQGNNVLMISLEMDESDLRERLSGRAFGINIDDYSRRRQQIRGMIEELDMSITSRGEQPRGELFLKRMYSPSHLDIDNMVKKTEKEKGVKIHHVVVDYFTEMGNAYGIKPDNAFNTYMYHKTNSKGLFDIAGEGDYTVISAHQSSKIDSTATDMFLEDLSESKGILHSPDTVIGIIQGDTHKKERRYFLKGLKTRHSGYKGHYVMYNIDYQKMYLTEGAIYKPEDYEHNGVLMTHDAPSEDITETK